MEANKILQADLIDIIFEGRNKQYGAYELRKSYLLRLKKSLMSVGGLLVLFLLGIYLTGKHTNIRKSVFVGPEILIASIMETTPPPPYIEAPPASPYKNQVRFPKPVITNNSMISNNDRIGDITDEQEIGTQTVNTNNGNSPIQAPYTEQNSAVTEIPAKKNVEPPVYIVVEIEAKFPGGFEEWKKYLEKNIDPEIAVNNGAPEGIYTVIVRFIVNSDGSISDVFPETNLGYGMEREAVRIIKNGPKWVPAKQNGQQVNAYKWQPITFVVNGR